MTRQIITQLRRFWRNEHGSANTIEFVLWVPVFLSMIVATVEMGAMSMRHTQLERSLDATVRMVRLGTGQNLTHDILKTSICNGAPLLKDCQSTLKLEMIPLDLRNWAEPPTQADCVDTAQPVNPLRHFENGQSNQLMYLRACYKYRPIQPAGLLASAFSQDANGYTTLVSFSAFVQEPK